MLTSILKKEIHEAIDRISDPQILSAFHKIISIHSAEDISGDDDLTDDQWKEIERRREDYLHGRSKAYSLEVFIAKADAIKKSFKKKVRHRAESAR
ncbi:MAG: hypothetical protein LH473_13770 [Chitinophagales bacterium]|nr:hypothetical protein [Chitinophagales bacterium]